MKYIVEYEVVPLRAIYTEEVEAANKEHAERIFLSNHSSKVRIRKIY